MPDRRVEIIRVDGSSVIIDRRSPLRRQPTYPRPAGGYEHVTAKDRRQKRRVPDEVFRGRVIDTSS